MALIDINEEIKRHNGSVTVQLSVESIISFIDDAINKHLVPAISDEQYSALLSWKAQFVKYDPASTYEASDKVVFVDSRGMVQFFTAVESVGVDESPENAPDLWEEDNSKSKSALMLAQKAVVNFAISYYVSFGSLQLSDSGAHVIQSGENKIASDKKLIQLKRQAMGDGHFALELVVQYLDLNLASFPDYAASSAYERNKGCFINYSSEFNEVGTIQVDSQLFAGIRNIMKQVEEDAIQPILGEDLYTALKASVLADDLSENESSLLLRIQRALVPLTLAEAIPYKMISIDATGAFQLSDTVGGISGNVENKRPAEERTAQAVMNRLCSKGEAELESLRKWLNKNYTLFEEYTQSGSRGEQNPNTGGGIYML